MVPKCGRFWLISILVLLAVFIGTTVLWGMVSADAREQTVVNGVSVEGVTFGGLDRDACTRKLAEMNEQLKGTPLTLRLDHKSWEVELGRLGVGLDIEGMTADALSVGRQGLFINQWIERRRTEQYGVSLPLRIRISEKDMVQAVEELAGEVIKPPVNAGFTITERDTVEIVPDEPGFAVDYAALKNSILQSIDAPGLPSVGITLVEVPPDHTLDEVRAMRLNGLVSEFSTRFDPSLIDRSYNVAVASKALDKLLIPPGDVVSFNEIVGPRSQEAGYRSALIIIENEFEEGMGGGVCQVSSTLYNTVLLANLEIIERKNHSLPVAYVPIGRDATVVYEAIDFQFRNNTGGFLYLTTDVGNGVLTMKLFGDAENHPRVEIRSWVTETIEPRVIYEDDPMLEVGEQLTKKKGVKGYRVQAERWIWMDGSLNKSEIPPSFYLPQNEVIAVGTREVPPAVIAPVPDNGSPGADEDNPEEEGNSEHEDEDEDDDPEEEDNSEDEGEPEQDNRPEQDDENERTDD